MRLELFASRYGWDEEQVYRQRPVVLDGMMAVWAERRHAQEAAGR